jgi:hypothetical protein
MKIQNVGFAFLLLGLILAVSGEAILFWTGVFLGVIGFLIVIAGSRDKNSNT